MPSTLNPTCPLCGLRYTDRPLLDLHIREDHLRDGDRAEPGHDDSGGAAASQPSAQGLLPLHRPGSALLSTTDEVMTTTAQQPRRSRSGWAVTALRRAIRALRYVNEELTLASEAIARSARAQQSHPAGDRPAGKMPAQLPLPNALTRPPDSMAGQRGGPGNGYSPAIPSR